MITIDMWMIMNRRTMTFIEIFHLVPASSIVLFGEYLMVLQFGCKVRWSHFNHRQQDSLHLLRGNNDHTSPQSLFRLVKSWGRQVNNSRPGLGMGQTFIVWESTVLGLGVRTKSLLSGVQVNSSWSGVWVNSPWP